MVYLIHFATPYKHASHYVGFASRLETRLKHHAEGRGARLMWAVTKAGIPYEVVRKWDDGDRNFERRIHNKKNTKKLCPVCNPTGYDKVKI